MRILYCSRPDAFSRNGGDTVQMSETREAVAARGHEVSISLDREPDATAFDLVHVFNMQGPEIGLAQIENAKRQGKPVALSTIYWDQAPVRHAPDVLRYGPDARVRQLARFSIEAAALATDLRFRLPTSEYRQMRQMLTAADVLLPNSVAELEIIVAHFRYPEARAKAVVVPNAVRFSADNESVGEGTARALADLPSAFVLEVARIEPVKGQLALIRAMQSHPEIPLVFVGPAAPSPYSDAFLRAVDARPSTFFVGEVAHGDVFAFYRRAKVHALPSLRESPGLATLEAAVHGCNCVVGTHAPVQEYFRNDAWICIPEDDASIARAVRDALAAPFNPALGQRIRNELTWARAADHTLEGYARIL